MREETITITSVPARKAFIDPAVQAAFESDGYVVIPGFLDKGTMNDLTALYDRFSPGEGTGFHVTNWIKDSNYSAEAHRSISAALSGKLMQVLIGYKPVLGCFAVKEAGDDNTMGLHQDWSVTDESRYCGVSAWVPFVDVAADSGALRVLKGSHRLFTNIRGQKIKNQLDDIPAGEIDRHLVTVPMRAGDMLVLHHRLVHCSGHTPHRRIVAMMAMIPQESAVKHYMSDTADPGGNDIKAYDCADDFYVHFDIGAPPAPGLAAGTVRQDSRVVTSSVIADYYSR